MLSLCPCATALFSRKSLFELYDRSSVIGELEAYLVAELLHVEDSTAASFANVLRIEGVRQILRVESFSGIPDFVEETPSAIVSERNDDSFFIVALIPMGYCVHVRFPEGNGQKMRSLLVQSFRNRKGLSRHLNGIDDFQATGGAQFHIPTLHIHSILFIVTRLSAARRVRSPRVSSHAAHWSHNLEVSVKLLSTPIFTIQTGSKVPPGDKLPCGGAQLLIGMAQINPTVGDLEGNLRLIREALRKGEEAGLDIVVGSELCVSGYPPKDLLERPHFVKHCREALEDLAGDVGETAALVGFPEQNASKTGKSVFNSCALLHQSRVVSVTRKTLLPTYDIFDENRYFEPSTNNAPVNHGSQRLGVTICEDLWNDPDFWPKRLYRIDPVARLVTEGADIIINCSSSPYDTGKENVRFRMLQNRVKKIGKPVIYVNQIGGNDELIFDGNSLAFGADGALLARGKAFEEDFLMVDTDTENSCEWETPCLDENLYKALVLGTRDYVVKCGFQRAVVGLSGGIDSAVTVALAVAALGKDNVLGVSMPSRYSSEGSKTDARALATNLGICLEVVPIDTTFNAYLEMMEPVFRGQESDVTEENVQARIRGNILMAVSNKFGHLVLSTGNKSELAVGYCTLYGDMAGGLAVIADVPKTRVYELAKYINRDKTIIPETILRKAPSAELRPNQTDQDTLPPYEVLDPILEAYVEDAKEIDEIVALGFDSRTVEEVIRRVDANEYKRYQAAPALKVTPRAFGTGWRMPIAQGYRR